MASPPKPKTFNMMMLRLGNGATPEVFTSPCALASRGIAFSAQVDENTVFGCPGSDPVAYEFSPAWVEAAVSALSATVSGSGTLAVGDFNTWWGWFRSGQARNVQIHIRSQDKGTLIAFTLSAVLASLELQQENENGTVNISLSIRANGEVTAEPVEPEAP